MKVRVGHEGAGLLLHRVAFVGVCFGCISLRNAAVGLSPRSPILCPCPAPSGPRPGLGPREGDAALLVRRLLLAGLEGSERGAAI